VNTERLSGRHDTFPVHHLKPPFICLLKKKLFYHLFWIKKYTFIHSFGMLIH
jgi:hypothetical protein